MVESKKRKRDESRDISKRAYKVPAQMPEVKCVDIITNNLMFDYNLGLPTPVALNLVASGSGFNQRVGRKVACKSIEIRWVVHQISTVTIDESYMARLLVVWDYATNGSAPNWTDVCSDVSNLGTTNSNSLANINISNRNRFKILFDHVFAPPKVAYNAQGNVGTIGAENHGRNYYRMKGAITQYKSDSGTPVVGDTVGGVAWLFAFSNSDDSLKNLQLTYNCRTRYVDT